MKALKSIGILFMVCLLASPTTSFAARPDPTPDGTGTLTGKVMIAGSRTGIDEATVTAVGADETDDATTDSTGTYTMTLVAGDYNVTATAAGYKDQTFSATIRSGRRVKSIFLFPQL